ncbi:MFS transporter, partial [Candidatus Bathyarchaeota archaeon]
MYTYAVTMPKQACKTIFGTSLKVAAVPIIMVANALIWYFYYFGFVGDIINTAGFSNVESLTIWGISFLVLALSALFSATLLNRTKSRNTFLFYWLSVGVIFSLIPLAIDITQLNLIIIFSFFGNMYFGLGMPICFGYFATVTEARNRSRMSGITFLCVFLGFFFLSVLNINEIALNSLVLAVWKFSGFAALLLIKPEEEKVFQSSRESYISILKKRPFLLYFTSWLMFSVVNYLAIPIISNSFTKVFGSDTFMYILESVLAAGFAVVFGFLGDYVGRKRLTVTGFILLGVGYASLGLFPKSITGQWFYLIVDGIAWGAFYTIFLMTLWGDLADGRNSEKYYAIGSLPYLFSNFMLISMGSYISDLVAQSAI